MWGATAAGKFIHIAALGISIHAPAWGATDIPCVRHDEDGISIHAPAWGATVFSDKLVCQLEISIPAPAWGATH
ncbi:MAG: hypothetical protein ACLTNY_07515, partial [Blautia massiliensis (ex Durand et al. 2017)]